MRSFVESAAYIHIKHHKLCPWISIFSVFPENELVMQGRLMQFMHSFLKDRLILMADATNARHWSIVSDL